VIRIILNTLILIAISIFTCGQPPCNFIEKVQNYQDSVKLISGPSGDQIDTYTFNLEIYLRFFNNLSFPKGMACGYAYLDNFLDGNPYLYVLEDSINLDGYIDKHIPQKNYHNNKRKEQARLTALYKFLNDSTRRAKFNITPEDSQDGYLQYLFFYIMGEQFALKWHSNYDEKFIICSNEGIYKVIRDYQKSKSFDTNIDELKNLNLINPEPIIILKTDYCLITWIEINTHFGIHRRTYRISRLTPYKIDLLEDMKLVTINPNFFY